MEKSELEKLINTLPEDSFRNLITEYLKKKYRTPSVRIVDGPYDGGNDIEIEKDGKVLKHSIQVTVQDRGYETKLQRDLESIQQNISERGYNKKFDFYITKSIGKKTREQLQTDAEFNGVDLKIWDARLLTEEAKIFEVIRRLAYKGHGIQSGREFVKADRNTKILFDVLTLNQDTVEIRKNMIYSLIFIYLNDNPGTGLDELYASLNPTLGNSLKKNYLFQQINYLKSKDLIVSPDNDKGVFFLSDDQAEKINSVKTDSELQEYELNHLLSNFIQEHNIPTTAEELVSHLKELYYQNYQIEVDEVTSKSDSFGNSLKKSHRDMVRFFESRGLEKENAESVTKQLLQRCEENEYLAKLGATLLFTNLYESEQLEQWVGKKAHRIVLDTQILIRLLVVLFDETVQHRDIALQSIKALWNSFESSNVELITTHGYLKEVAAHLLEAIKLERFLSLPYFEELGRSKNVFFNAYEDFLERDIIDEETSLNGFFSQLLGVEDELPYFLDNRLISVTTPLIQNLFEDLGIETIPYQEYDLYQRVKRTYEITLDLTKRNRSYNARKHDLLTIMFLTDENNHLNDHGQLNEPFLVTWDGAFYDFRKELFKRGNALGQELSYWYIYSPLKLVDRLAVLNFKVDPKAINANIISLVEDNFNYSSKTTSFLDVINSIFHKEDLSQIPLLHHFTSLKRDTESLQGDNESQYEDETQLAEVMLSLRDYYANPQHKYDLDDLAETMEATEVEDNILSLLKQGLEIYSNPRTREKLDELWIKFDKLIRVGREGNG